MGSKLVPGPEKMVRAQPTLPHTVFSYKPHTECMKQLLEDSEISVAASRLGKDTKIHSPPELAMSLPTFWFSLWAWSQCNLKPKSGGAAKHKPIPLILAERAEEELPAVRERTEVPIFLLSWFSTLAHPSAPKQSWSSSSCGRNGSLQEPKTWEGNTFLPSLWSSGSKTVGRTLVGCVCMCVCVRVCACRGGSVLLFGLYLYAFLTWPWMQT